MTMTMPGPVEIPKPSLMEQLGTGLGAGIQSVVPTLGKLMEQQIMQQSLKQALSPQLAAQPTQDYAERVEGRPIGASPQRAEEMQQSRLEQIATNPEAMAILAANRPQIAAQIQEMYGNLIKQRQFQSKEKLEREKQAYTESKSYIDSIREKASDLPGKRIAMVRINDALQANDLKSLQNFVADFFNNDYLRTSSGAALQSAVKEFLLSDLGKVKGGRPNQFIEQQLSQSYTKAGYDPKANAKIAAAMEAGVKLNQAEVELADRMQEEYMEAGEKIPGNFDYLVRKELKGLSSEIEQDLVEKYKEINKSTEIPGKTGRSFKGLEDIQEKVGNLKVGDRARSKKTNQEYVWTGKEWKPVKGEK